MTLSIQTPATLDKPRLPARPPVVYYPDSDGQPMAENDPQYRCITDTRFALEQYYREHPTVYVGADLLVYYVEGDPGKSVAPDVLISLDVGQGNRRSYMLWVEGKAPDVVFEFASEKTWQADLGWKHGLYQGLGIQEYFLFDPLGEYFQPSLQGYRLSGKVYEAIFPLPLQPDDPRGELGLASQLLGLELWLKPNPDPDSLSAKSGETTTRSILTVPFILRLYDPQTASWLLTPVETDAARRSAEAEIARLRQELARLREQG